jgi:predicted MFS family arabinose efflux permease
VLDDILYIRVDTSKLILILSAVVGFFVVDFPIGLAMNAFPAQRVFAVATLTFGPAACLISVAGGFAGLMVLRLILGCGEAVFTMGFLYLSLRYKPEELALRTGDEACCFVAFR